jgi:hypothetical protein
VSSAASEEAMTRFLIEVPHQPEEVACAQVVDVFQRSGSHWITHADWGCRDGDHKAWIIIEANNKDEARRIVPPAFRDSAKITGLNKFSVEEIGTILREHRG